MVNAGLGWGTLVHEMVHAFIDADFPSAPVWINEGLASLFEAPVDVDGHIHGAPNWRLPPLQRAILANRAPSFHATTHASRGDFDGERGPLHYATSRYVLYWLQEQGLLRAFYRAYRARGAGDGLDLLSTLTKRPVSEVRRDWEVFVLGLTYERR